MRRKWLCFAAAICMALTGCSGVSAQAKAPLMGLEWFTSYDEVKQALDHTLLDERENAEQKVPQKMLDYTGVSLFEYECDLTLCFTDAGLIGLNYHDIGKNQNYKEWYSTLEKTYGLPTEEGSGMASWYDNPLGKDTAVYLFNLEEGVQISIYATADSPDKSARMRSTSRPRSCGRRSSRSVMHRPLPRRLHPKCLRRQRKRGRIPMHSARAENRRIRAKTAFS